MSLRVVNLWGSAADYMLFQGLALYGYQDDEFDGYEYGQRLKIDASPIYTSLSMTITVEGTRFRDYGGGYTVTEVIDYTRTRVFTRIPIAGAVAYAGRVFPRVSIDNSGTSLGAPSGTDNAYFFLGGDGFGLDPIYESEYNLMRFDRQCLHFRWNFDGDYRVIGTRTVTDDTDPDVVTDIYQSVDLIPPQFGYSEAAQDVLTANKRAYPDLWVTSLGDDFNLDISGWSAATWRDYRGSYSTGEITDPLAGWDTTDITRKLDWVLS